MSPSGHKETKELSAQIVPSMQALKKCRARAAISEGRDPGAHGSVRDRYNAKPGEIFYGHAVKD